MKFFYIKFIALFIPAALSSSLKAQGTGTLTLDISHVVGASPLKLDSTSYKNSLNQTFTVSKFKYYIGQIQLKEKGGKVVQSKNYFLINEDDEDSKHLIFEKVPFGEYTSISFLLGVDSLSNCNGAQSGALDPVNAMFWAWNTGYIFLKLEGNSIASPLPAHMFEYHIGGYKNPANCVRTIQLPLTGVLIDEKAAAASVSLNADLLKIFSSNSTVDFKTLPSVTDFHNATDIADNYKNMFSISTPKHEN